MTYSFHPAAEQEFLGAINYYEECQEGLGREFAKEVYSAIDNIISFPHAWPSISPRTRRCLTNRFPYGVVYQIGDDEIYIIAVMHLNREPAYWQHREI